MVLLVKLPLCSWDQNLVLSVLRKQPFEPIWHISIGTEAGFFGRITMVRRVSELPALSCKEPFLALNQDRVVLLPQPDFLLKVVSSFHVNQDIYKSALFFSESLDYR